MKLPAYTLQTLLDVGPQVQVPPVESISSLVSSTLLWTQTTSSVLDEMQKLLGCVLEQQQLTPSHQPYCPPESICQDLSKLSRCLLILSDVMLRVSSKQPEDSAISLPPTIPLQSFEILTSSMPSQTTSPSSTPTSKEPSQSQASLPWYRQEPQNPKHVLPQEDDVNPLEEAFHSEKLAK